MIWKGTRKYGREGAPWHVPPHTRHSGTRGPHAPSLEFFNNGQLTSWLYATTKENTLEKEKKNVNRSVCGFWQILASSTKFVIVPLRRWNVSSSPRTMQCSKLFHCALVCMLIWVVVHDRNSWGRASAGVHTCLAARLLCDPQTCLILYMCLVHKQLYARSMHATFDSFGQSCMLHPPHVAYFFISSPILNLLHLVNFSVKLSFVWIFVFVAIRTFKQDHSWVHFWQLLNFY